jgi:hypothetical protein
MAMNTHRPRSILRCVSIHKGVGGQVVLPRSLPASDQCGGQVPSHPATLHDTDLDRVMAPHCAEVKGDRFLRLLRIGRGWFRPWELRRTGSTFCHDLFLSERILLVPGLHHQNHGYGNRQINPRQQKSSAPIHARKPSRSDRG